MSEKGDVGGLTVEKESLCLCMLYVSGAKTLTHTLDTYASTGLLEMAKESYIMYLEDKME